MCGKFDHDWTECPDREAISPAPPIMIDIPEEAASASSLAPTLLEEMYGRDALAALSIALDNQDFNAAEQGLADQLVSGDVMLADLGPADRLLLESLTDKIYYYVPSAKPVEEPQEPKVGAEWNPSPFFTDGLPEDLSFKE